MDPAVLDHIGVRDFAGRWADVDLDVIVADEMLELLDEIIAEQLGPSDAGGVGARLVEAGEGARRRRRGKLPAILYTELGIGERPLLASSRIGRASVLDVAGKCLAEVRDGVVVDGCELVDDSVGVELTFHGPL